MQETKETKQLNTAWDVGFDLGSNKQINTPSKQEDVSGKAGEIQFVVYYCTNSQTVPVSALPILSFDNGTVIYNININEN